MRKECRTEKSKSRREITRVGHEFEAIEALESHSAELEMLLIVKQFIGKRIIEHLAHELHHLHQSTLRGQTDGIRHGYTRDLGRMISQGNS